MEYIIENGRKRKADYFVCEQCGTKFLKALYRIIKNRKLFCNRECLAKYNQEKNYRTGTFH